MMWKVLSLVFVLIHCEILAQIKNESQDKYVSCLINHLNSLPNRVYLYEDGILLSADKKDHNLYNVQASLKVGQNDGQKFKLLRCVGDIQDANGDLKVVENSCSCTDEQLTHFHPAARDNDDSEESSESDESTETTPVVEDVQAPIKLDHEVQPTNVMASGEQFVAIRREEPKPRPPCVGCSSFVDINAKGVDDLAALAIKHIDRHEPSVRHVLANVISVERQVQVVNGVRYIIHLEVEFNNCTEGSDIQCTEKKTCRVTVLEKPWMRLPDGSKFRAIISNNCTDQYLFGDNGEVVDTTYENDKLNKENNEINVFNNVDPNVAGGNGDAPTFHPDNIENSGSLDDEMVKKTDKSDLLSSPVSTMTQTDIKNLEKQIIPYSEFNKHNDEQALSEQPNNEPFVKQVAKDNAATPVTVLSNEKKSALESFIDAFNIDIPQADAQKAASQRTLKRSVRSVKYFEHDQDYINFLGETLVNTLNDFDMEVKNRTLQKVLLAEEDLQTTNPSYFLRASVLFPCLEESCQDKHIEKICNAVIDLTLPKHPRVTKSFCRKGRSGTIQLGNRQEIKLDDPEVELLAKDFLKKYDNNSNNKKVKLLNILSADRQVASGILTRISLEIGFVKCPTSEIVTNKCELDENQNIMICKVLSQEKLWSKEKDISYQCDDKVEDNIISSVDSQKIKGILPLKIHKRSTYLRELDDDTEAENLFSRELSPDDEASLYKSVLAEINRKSHTKNLQKVVKVESENIKDADSFVIKVFTAYTTCLKGIVDEDQIDYCDQLEYLEGNICEVNVTISRKRETPDVSSVVCHGEFEKKSKISKAETKELPPEDPLTLAAEVIDHLHELTKDNRRLLLKSVIDYNATKSEENPSSIRLIIVVTNCSKSEPTHVNCVKLPNIPSEVCSARLWPSQGGERKIKVFCKYDSFRTKRSLEVSDYVNNNDTQIQSLVQDSIRKLEALSTLGHRQRLIRINEVVAQTTAGKLTRINFDVAYTTCTKFQLVQNETACEYLKDYPERNCISEIWERIWLKSGKEIDVTCYDKTNSTLANSVKIDNTEAALQLAEEALKIVEAKYASPKKQKIVKVLAIEKQVVAGIHYRVDFEVGFTDCWSLSLRSDCNVTNEYGPNKFCKAKLWLRPWLDEGSNIRVTCSGEENDLSDTKDLYTDVQVSQIFLEFQNKYNKKYFSGQEYRLRYTIFKANLKKIENLNIQEKGTAVYGVTKFADLTYEEFQRKHMGLKLNKNDSNAIPRPMANIPDIDLPASFDWREKGAVTEVKNQGMCGSCWAFSVTGNVEGQWKLKTGELLSLSEQELVDCDKLDDGCNGGLPDNAYRAIEELGGLETETDYPYEGDDEKCHYNKSISRVQVAGAVNITANETGMAQWLVSNGPISIGINANAMQFYMGGISHPWKVLCSPKNLDHGVLIVGYGYKDYPLFHKHLPYWIIKNSWGEDWGESGYYRVYRGDGTCGVNQMASSAVV